MNKYLTETNQTLDGLPNALIKQIKTRALKVIQDGKFRDILPSLSLELGVFLATNIKIKNIWLTRCPYLCRGRATAASSFFGS